MSEVRKQFPILQTLAHGKPLVYLDNAATTQKPKSVIDAVSKYYEGLNSNIHRGAHYLADKATAAYEETRKALQQFVNANEVEEIIFTSGTTNGINLLAQTYGKAFINSGDEIIISYLEHHSNIVPWQMIAEEKGATVKVVSIDEKGQLVMSEYEQLLSEKTKLVAINHASNALGTINPIDEIIRLAHQVGAKVMIDGAQGAPHLDIDVQAQDIDFYVSSAHKMYGPTGVGFLYGKRELLEKMPPYMGGGEMIKEVSFEGTTYNEIPYKFEAGTPNIGDVIAYKHAIAFINKLGKGAIREHEDELLQLATQLICEIPGIKLVGTAEDKAPVLSFVHETVHSYDLGMMLDAKGIAVRTGHHCTQPLMKLYKLEGTVRASFAVYNTKEEVHFFIESLKQIINLF
ncbi:MAG: aminotransferase class V-fold PLP-dependent enzyme [Cyclobacteriaceae bacterium]